MNWFLRVGATGFESPVNEIAGDSNAAAHLLEFDSVHGIWVYYSLNKESLFLIKEWITSLTDYSSNRKRCCE